MISSPDIEHTTAKKERKYDGGNRLGYANFSKH